MNFHPEVSERVSLTWRNGIIDLNGQRTTGRLIRQSLMIKF